MASAVYILFMSFSGAILLFYGDLYARLTPHPSISSGPPLDPQELTGAVLAAHPGFEITHVWPGRTRHEAVEIWVTDGTHEKHHLFDPATAADLGDAEPAAVHVLNMIKDLHHNLGIGPIGRRVNQLGAAALITLGLTGAVLLWRPRRPAMAADLSRKLHAKIGLWMLPFAMVWGVTGLVVAAGNLAIVSSISPSFADQLFRWNATVHFARFPAAARILAACASAAFVALVITGMFMKRLPIRRKSRRHKSHTARRRRVPAQFPANGMRAT